MYELQLQITAMDKIIESIPLLNRASAIGLVVDALAEKVFQLEMSLIDISVQELITDVNKKNHVRITIDSNPE